MSLKRLLVNARTKILEFKKKHNYLVEKVSEVEEDIPTNAEITALANSAIQADKDILSKITVEYDENTGATTFTFPTGIEPMRFANDNGSVFFDYSTNNLIDYLGDNVGECGFSDEGQCYFIVAGEYDINYIVNLTYILFENGIEEENWYALLIPQPAGTKLYVHNIDLHYGTSDIYSVKIISNIKTAFTKNELYYCRGRLININTSTKDIFILAYGLADKTAFNNFSFKTIEMNFPADTPKKGNYAASKIDLTTGELIVNMTSADVITQIDDTVTEL